MGRLSFLPENPEKAGIADAIATVLAERENREYVRQVPTLPLTRNDYAQPTRFDGLPVEEGRANPPDLPAAPPPRPDPTASEKIRRASDAALERFVDEVEEAWVDDVMTVGGKSLDGGKDIASFVEYIVPDLSAATKLASKIIKEELLKENLPEKTAAIFRLTSGKFVAALDLLAKVRMRCLFIRTVFICVKKLDLLKKGRSSLHLATTVAVLLDASRSKLMVTLRERGVYPGSSATIVLLNFLFRWHPCERQTLSPEGHRRQSHQGDPSQGIAPAARRRRAPATAARHRARRHRRASPPPPPSGSPPPPYPGRVL